MVFCVIGFLNAPFIFLIGIFHFFDGILVLNVAILMNGVEDLHFDVVAY